jgi:DNA polymerase-3 subunit epsilon
MKPNDRADTVVVLDFETTGLSPDRGDRAIEIGAVRLEGGSIHDRFQCLMNPGRRISPFIEQYTGISNTMLKTAPPCEEVMAACRDFIGDHDLVAHNASFDQRFLDAELQRINRPRRGAFACSMLAARRLYPEAPNHKLGTLVAYRQLPHRGTFHRALADAEMTAHLWLGMLGDLTERYRLEPVSFAMMRDLTRLPRGSVITFLQAHARTAL